MITFKQMEALYWIVQLGSFEAAASKLHMSQSAISKRIHELEEVFDVEIFDRTYRNARLTEKGYELLECAKDLLERRDYLIERVCANNVLVKRLRLGTTELTALTWLPSFINTIQQHYPKLQLEPTVDSSWALFTQLENDQVDLVVVPGVFNDARFISTPLNSVENAWMCNPKLTNLDQPIPINELSQFTVLSQGMHSGTGIAYERWLENQSLEFDNRIVSNNLLAQIGMALAGLGVSYLPKSCLSHLLDKKLLRVIETTPILPPVRYAALYRADRKMGLGPKIAALAQQCCDFSTLVF